MREATDGTGYYRESRGILALCFAVLAGPLAWALGLNVGYALVLPACARGAVLPLHLVSVATLLLAAAGGLVAWREWRRIGGGTPDEAGGTIARSRFMAVLGLLASAFFSLVIVAQWIASLTLDPCMGI
jgi:hypothetical protein